MFYLGTYGIVSGSFEGGAPRDGGAYAAIIMVCYLHALLRSTGLEILRCLSVVLQVYLYAAAYCISWNAMPWLFAAEVFPTKIRSLGMLISVLNQWVAQFIIVYATPFMITGMKSGTFYFFGACTLVAGFVVYCLMPETKGFALEDMHFIFETGHWWAPEARRVGEELRRQRDPENELGTGLHLKDGSGTDHVELGK